MNFVPQCLRPSRVRLSLRPSHLATPWSLTPRSFRAPVVVVVVDLIITVLSSEREKFANSLPSTEIRALIRQEAGATPAISPSSFVPYLGTLGTFRGEERNRVRLCRRDFRRFDPDAKRKRWSRTGNAELLGIKLIRHQWDASVPWLRRCSRLLRVS